jgi:hypothetical protein
MKKFCTDRKPLNDRQLDDKHFTISYKLLKRYEAVQFTAARQGECSGQWNVTGPWFGLRALNKRIQH